MKNSNEKRNCAFQYYDGRVVVSDKFNLTLDEAKELWNNNYDNMVAMASKERDIEVAIWINMDNDTDYKETLIHLDKPIVKNGVLCEEITKKYNKF